MHEVVRLLRNRDYEGALERLLTLEADAEKHPEISYYLGLCYTHLERYDEALLYLEQVITSEMGFAYVYQSRMIVGYIYAVTERYRLAEFEFSRLVDDGYESAKVYAALGYVLYAQDNVAGAVANLQKALKMDPHNATALNSLGYVMAENEIKLDVAEDYCRRALAIKPDYPAYLDSLGWVQYKLGKVKEARDVLRKALLSAPDNEEIQRHLREVTGAAKRVR